MARKSSPSIPLRVEADRATGSHSDRLLWLQRFRAAATTGKRLKVVAQLPLHPSGAWAMEIQKAQAIAMDAEQNIVAGRLQRRLQAVDGLCEDGSDPTKPHSCPRCAMEGSILYFGTRNVIRQPKLLPSGEFDVRRHWAVTYECRQPWTTRKGKVLDTHIRIAVRQSQCSACRNGYTDVDSEARAEFWERYEARHGLT